MVSDDPCNNSVRNQAWRLQELLSPCQYKKHCIIWYTNCVQAQRMHLFPPDFAWFVKRLLEPCYKGVKCWTDAILACKLRKKANNQSWQCYNCCSSFSFWGSLGHGRGKSNVLCHWQGWCRGQRTVTYDNNDDNVYLPSNNSTCLSYYHYCLVQGYKVQSTATGNIAKEWVGFDGYKDRATKPSIVLLGTYHRFWKRNYPNVKVSPLH